MQADQELLIAAYKDDCRVLGPGRRFSLWVQGCPFHCEGCIADSMHSFEGGRVVSVGELADRICCCEEIEGITISGGEPFMQAGELAELLEMVRKRRPDLGVIVYTGFSYERLRMLAADYQEVDAFLAQIDLLIDGPYIEAQNDDTGMKGSKNQRTILFSQRYADDLGLFDSPSAGRKTELYQDDGQNFLAGVPSRELAGRWKKLKEQRVENMEF